MFPPFPRQDIANAVSAYIRSVSLQNALLNIKLVLDVGNWISPLLRTFPYTFSLFIHRKLLVENSFTNPLHKNNYHYDYASHKKSSLPSLRTH